MTTTARSRAEQHAFNERRWAEIMDESFADGSISKIETDREGNVIMSPSAGKDHGVRQAETGFNTFTSGCRNCGW
jgi:hypothetical protein